MKNYYLILIENFIGIGYLILFLIGFYSNNLNLYHIGGIGMPVFILIMIKDQPKKIFTFLLLSGIGCAISYFIFRWWIGLYWVSALFTVGQLFGIAALIKNKEKIKNINISKSGIIANPDNIAMTEILFLIGLIIGPVLFANNIEKKENKVNPFEKEIEQQVIYIEKSKKFSNKATDILNSSDFSIKNQNQLQLYKELINKSIQEARKVDTTVLNQIKKGFGTVYYQKYLKGKELELKGLETGNSSFMKEGQTLYDEYIDWHEQNLSKK